MRNEQVQVWRQKPVDENEPGGADVRPLSGHEQSPRQEQEQQTPYPRSPAEDEIRGHQTHEENRLRAQELEQTPGHHKGLAGASKLVENAGPFHGVVPATHHVGGPRDDDQRRADQQGHGAAQGVGDERLAGGQPRRGVVRTRIVGHAPVPAGDHGRGLTALREHEGDGYERHDEQQRGIGDHRQGVAYACRQCVAPATAAHHYPQTEHKPQRQKACRQGVVGEVCDAPEHERGANRGGGQGDLPANLRAHPEKHAGAHGHHKGEVEIAHEQKNARGVAAAGQGVHLHEWVGEKAGDHGEVHLVHEGTVAERPAPRHEHRERLVLEIDAEAEAIPGEADGRHRQSQSGGRKQLAPCLDRPASPVMLGASLAALTLRQYLTM